jgi:hypothetical protein
MDRKSKKLNFSFKMSDVGSLNSVASLDTVDMLKRDIELLQEKLDGISRNVYIQQDLEREHFDCNSIIH